MQWIDSLRGALSFWNKGLQNGESSDHQSIDLFPVGTLDFPTAVWPVPKVILVYLVKP